LIIDEEQRFGVRHKEHFKKLRSELDILSLSATPIPRTLSLTMAKLRGISQVNDPPPERIAIKNFVLPYSDEISAGAIRAELERGGQTYVLHNRVETISEAARKLQELIPDAKIGIIHGRMDEKTLLRELTRFREEYNLPDKKTRYFHIRLGKPFQEKKLKIPSSWRDEAILEKARKGFDELSKRS